MKLMEITALNFRGFSDVNLKIDGKNTIFFGINGVGKSSILALINFLFRPLCNRLNLSQGKAFNTLSDNDIYFNQTNMEIEIRVDSNQHSYNLNRKLRKATPGKRRSSTYTQNEYVLFANEIRSSVDENHNLPVFVNYGTNRSVLQIPLRIRNKHEFTQYTAFEHAVENYIDFKTFFEWFRNQEDIENEYIRDHGDNTYRDKSLQCVRHAVQTMLDHVSGLRIKRSPLRMVVEKDGKELMVDYLSDGEKCTLALFGDLARRLAAANPDMENPLCGEGIVLIDEIELHMHPNWQRKILSVMKSVFPNIQFIVTTHSPQVLGELNDEYQIFHIKQTENNNNYISSVKRMDGFDANYILENYMDTLSVSSDFQKKLKNIYDLIETNQFDEADREIKEIIQITELNHTEVIRLEGALKRGKFIYEKHHKV